MSCSHHRGSRWGFHYLRRKCHSGTFSAVKELYLDQRIFSGAEGWREGLEDPQIVKTVFDQPGLSLVLFLLLFAAAEPISFTFTLFTIRLVI